MSIPVPGGATMSLDLSGTTQLAGSFSVANSTVNGNAPASVSSVTIGTDGTLSYQLSNGSTVAGYKISLASVASPDNLQPITGNAFSVNILSGQPSVGTAGTGELGTINSSELEQSTVDIATELTNMIVAQRGYEANSQVFKAGADLFSNSSSQFDVQRNKRHEPLQRLERRHQLACNQRGPYVNRLAQYFQCAEFDRLCFGESGQSRHRLQRRGGHPVDRRPHQREPVQLQLSSTSAMPRRRPRRTGVTHCSTPIGRHFDQRTPPPPPLRPPRCCKLWLPPCRLIPLRRAPSSAASAVFSAAQNLAQGLNTASATTQNVRETVDQDMVNSVATINSLLSQFQQVNTAIVNGTATGADVTDAQDQRNTILQSLSQQIGVTTSTASNNSMSIYTDSGVTLFDTTPRSVTMAATTTYTASTTGAAVYVDGVPVTGANAIMRSSPARSLASPICATLSPRNIRASSIPSPASCVNAFAETSPTAASLPGLFTYAGASSLPARRSVPGLASEITVSSAADPAQGGDPTLIRDGGINGAAYVQNSTGAAG